ncbi:RNA-directed DNA polymerase, eukaryota [Tanacetum coccineum]
MVAVYAPHDLRDKRILWDYLEYVINRWDGEVIIMGDFNEVRRKSERFGSAFNVQGADMFNTFIANAGLEEIPLGDQKKRMPRFDNGHASETNNKDGVHNSFNTLIKVPGNGYGLKSKVVCGQWCDDNINTFLVHQWLKSSSRLRIAD